MRQLYGRTEDAPPVTRKEAKKSLSTEVLSASVVDPNRRRHWFGNKAHMMGRSPINKIGRSRPPRCTLAIKVRKRRAPQRKGAQAGEDEIFLFSNEKNRQRPAGQVERTELKCRTEITTIRSGSYFVLQCSWTLSLGTRGTVGNIFRGFPPFMPCPSGSNLRSEGFPRPSDYRDQPSTRMSRSQKRMKARARPWMQI